MVQSQAWRGSRRRVAVWAATALGSTLLSTGLAAPAEAAPVAVTTTVTDAAGNAVDGSVTVWEVTGSGTARGLTQEVSDGMVRLQLEPGTYKFEFRAEGFLTEFHADQATLEAAAPVTVSDPVSLPPVALAPAGLVTGRVTDHRGRPLPHVSVSAHDVATGEAATGHTGRDGRFALAAQPGRYKLHVAPATVGDTSYSGEYYNDKATYAEAEVVTQTAAGVDVGSIALSTGARVAGRVTGTGGVPLERVLVSAHQPDCTAGCSSSSDYTDAAGGYLLEGLAPGSYALGFSDPAGEYRSEHHADAADVASATRLVVTKDQELTGVDAALLPAAAIDPAAVDLSGRIVDSSGAPVIGARVSAFSTPARRKNVRRVDEVRTDREGYYAFTGLDPAASGVGEDTFKIEAVDGLPVEEDQFRRLSSFYGGATQYDHARTVRIPAGGQQPGIVITLPLTGGISGRISSEAGAPVMRTWAQFTNEDGNRVGGMAYAGYDGSYQTRSLPAGTYRVQYGDSGYSLAEDPYAVHVPEWHSNATSAQEARRVVVRSGQMTTGVNAALAVSLEAVQRPEIGGKPYVGKKVTASPGRWTLMGGTRFSYEWLLDGRVVGGGRQLGVAQAWLGKRLVLRVTAESGRFRGRALVTSQRLGRQPKVSIKAGKAAVIKVRASRVKAKRVAGKVTVREVVGTRANGRVRLKRVGSAKIRRGRATVSLAKVKGKGRHTLVFTFRMKGKVGNAEVRKTVRRAR